MFQAGPEGFKGGMNARKYGIINKISKATATRDLQQLAKLGALQPNGAGKATVYQLGI